MVTALESNAFTIAPIPFAIPIAAKPATPAPIINTFDGVILPAAVIYYLENLGKCEKASRVALYPAKLVVDDKVSNF